MAAANMENILFSYILYHLLNLTIKWAWGNQKKRKMNKSWLKRPIDKLINCQEINILDGTTTLTLFCFLSIAFKECHKRHFSVTLKNIFNPFYFPKNKKKKLFVTFLACSIAASLSQPYACVREWGFPYWLIKKGIILSRTRGSWINV